MIAREHLVDIGDGVRLHVLERGPTTSHRAVLMIPATLTTNALYDATVDGDESYNALSRVAHAGLAAYAVSYEGYGKSSMPADGAKVSFERSLVHMGRIVSWIRAQRDVRQVDILGTSVGSDIAVALGSESSPIDPAAVGRVVLTAMVYRRFSELVEREAFSDAFESFLRGLPQGMIDTQPAFYDLVLSELAPAARRWAQGTFPGRYATGPTLAAFSLPLFDAAKTRAPALLAWGSRDPVTPRSDVDALLAEHAAPIRLLELPDGGHSPFLEPNRDLFWSTALAFLD